MGEYGWVGVNVGGEKRGKYGVDCELSTVTTAVEATLISDAMVRVRARAQAPTWQRRAMFEIAHGIRSEIHYFLLPVHRNRSPDLSCARG